MLSLLLAVLCVAGAASAADLTVTGSLFPGDVTVPAGAYGVLTLKDLDNKRVLVSDGVSADAVLVKSPLPAASQNVIMEVTGGTFSTFKFEAMDSAAITMVAPTVVTGAVTFGGPLTALASINATGLSAGGVRFASSVGGAGSGAPSITFDDAVIRSTATEAISVRFDAAVGGVSSVSLKNASVSAVGESAEVLVFRGAVDGLQSLVIDGANLTAEATVDGGASVLRCDTDCGIQSISGVNTVMSAAAVGSGSAKAFELSGDLPGATVTLRNATITAVSRVGPASVLSFATLSGGGTIDVIDTTANASGVSTTVALYVQGSANVTSVAVKSSTIAATASESDEAVAVYIASSFQGKLAVEESTVKATSPFGNGVSIMIWGAVGAGSVLNVTGSTVASKGADGAYSVHVEGNMEGDFIVARCDVETTATESAKAVTLTAAKGLSVSVTASRVTATATQRKASAVVFDVVDNAAASIDVTASNVTATATERAHAVSIVEEAVAKRFHVVGSTVTAIVSNTESIAISFAQAATGIHVLVDDVTVTSTAGVSGAYALFIRLGLAGNGTGLEVRGSDVTVATNGSTAIMMASTKVITGNITVSASRFRVTADASAQLFSFHSVAHSLRLHTVELTLNLTGTDGASCVDVATVNANSIVDLRALTLTVDATAAVDVLRFGTVSNASVVVRGLTIDGAVGRAVIGTVLRIDALRHSTLSVHDAAHKDASAPVATDLRLLNITQEVVGSSVAVSVVRLETSTASPLRSVAPTAGAASTLCVSSVWFGASPFNVAPMIAVGFVHNVGCGSASITATAPPTLSPGRSLSNERSMSRGRSMSKTVPMTLTAPVTPSLRLGNGTSNDVNDSSKDSSNDSSKNSSQDSSNTASNGTSGSGPTSEPSSPASSAASLPSLLPSRASSHSAASSSVGRSASRPDVSSRASESNASSSTPKIARSASSSGSASTSGRSATASSADESAGRGRELNPVTPRAPSVDAPPVVIAISTSTTSTAAGITPTAALGQARARYFLTQCATSAPDGTEPLPFTDHPLHFAIGTGPARYHLGALAGTALLFAAAFAVVAVLVAVTTLIDVHPEHRAAAWVAGGGTYALRLFLQGFGGEVVMIAVVLLLTPAAASAVVCLLHPSGDVVPGARAAGAVALVIIAVICVALTVLTVAFTRRYCYSPDEPADLHDDKTPGGENGADVGEFDAVSAAPSTPRAFSVPVSGATTPGACRSEVEGMSQPIPSYESGMPTRDHSSHLSLAGVGRSRSGGRSSIYASRRSFALESGSSTLLCLHRFVTGVEWEPRPELEALPLGAADGILVLIGDTRPAKDEPLCVVTRWVDRCGCHWFFAVDLWVAVLTGVGAGLLQIEQCDGVPYVVMVLQLLFVIVFVVTRPLRSPLLLGVCFVMVLLQAALVVTAAATSGGMFGRSTDDDEPQALSIIALVLTLVLCVQGVVGIFVGAVGVYQRHLERKHEADHGAGSGAYALTSVEHLGGEPGPCGGGALQVGVPDIPGDAESAVDSEREAAPSEAVRME